MKRSMLSLAVLTAMYTAAATKIVDTRRADPLDDYIGLRSLNIDDGTNPGQVGGGTNVDSVANGNQPDVKSLDADAASTDAKGDPPADSAADQAAATT